MQLFDERKARVEKADMIAVMVADAALLLAGLEHAGREDRLDFLIATRRFSLPEAVTALDELAREKL